MKKRAFLCFAALLILTSFTACNHSESKENEGKETTTEDTAKNVTEAAVTEENDAQKPVTETVDRQVIDRTDEKAQEALAAYKAVLLDGAELVCTIDNEVLTFNQLINTIDDRLSLTKFAVIDLDGDNLTEIVFSLSNTEIGDVIYAILHYKNERVYEYTLSLREFNELKTDGTFIASGGASDWGTGAISFQQDEAGGRPYTLNKIAYCESNENSQVSYYVNHQNATKEEFDNAADMQSDKPEATWHDFKEENIKTFFQKQMEGDNALTGYVVTQLPPSEKSMLPQSVTETIDRQIIDRTNEKVQKALMAYKDVLLNQSDFVDLSNHNKNTTVSQEMTDYFNVAELELTRFSIIDLDRDSIPEVIISVSAPSDNMPNYYDYSDDREYIILHYDGKRVCGCTLWFRMFMCLKTDGTFSTSGSAFSGGIGAIAFIKDKQNDNRSYTITEFTRYDYAEADADGNPQPYYIVDDKNVSEDELQNALTLQNNKPDITWYVFSKDAIEQYFS